jgi:TPR repeat protein
VSTKEALPETSDHPTSDGLMYDKGQGVRQDHAAAASWYRKAAEQGIANAQFNLGIMYDNGEGVP